MNKKNNPRKQSKELYDLFSQAMHAISSGGHLPEGVTVKQDEDEYKEHKKAKKVGKVVGRREVTISGWIVKGENWSSEGEVEIRLSSHKRGIGKSLIDLMIDAMDCDDEVTDTDMAYEHYSADHVFIRYYVSNYPVTIDEAHELHIKTLFGNLEMSRGLLGYDEYSIDGEYHFADIGRHNIEEELENYDGKYLIMKISFNIRKEDNDDK